LLLHLRPVTYADISFFASRCFCPWLADGLYILLRPAKGGKKKLDDGYQAQIPQHLQHLVMTKYPPESCKWQLSGPQFPTPSAIQQRYCYPQGRKEYSRCTGSALWTMYNTDGIENKDYRLLHVYYSTKRLQNGGVRNSKNELDVSDQSSYSTVHPSTNVNSTERKFVKRHKSFTGGNDLPIQRQVPQLLSHQRHFHAVTSHPSNSSFPPTGPNHPPVHVGFPTSPIRYDPRSYTPSINGYTVSPASPQWPESTMDGGGDNNSNNCNNNNYNYRPQTPFQRHYNRSMSATEWNNDMNQNYRREYFYDQSPIVLTTPQVLPFRRHCHNHNHPHPHFDDYESADVAVTNFNPNSNSRDTFCHPSTDSTFSNFDYEHDDLHSIMMTPINDVDTESASITLWDEVSGTKILNVHCDPFSPITYASENDKKEMNGADIRVGDSIHNAVLPNESDCFQTSLERVHTNLRNCIHQAPSYEQTELVRMLSSWARQLADDPLIVSQAKVQDTTSISATDTRSSDNDEGDDTLSSKLIVAL
jgi:hypothetical protein